MNLRRVCIDRRGKICLLLGDRDTIQGGEFRPTTNRHASIRS